MTLFNSAATRSTTLLSQIQLISPMIPAREP